MKSNDLEIVKDPSLWWNPGVQPVSSRRWPGPLAFTLGVLVAGKPCTVYEANVFLPNEVELARQGLRSSITYSSWEALLEEWRIT
jgi:hypothetical protein